MICAGSLEGTKGGDDTVTTTRFGAVTGTSVLTGMAAGFLGVGGGEFRIPVLVDVLGYPLKLAGGINLVIGLFTVALSIARRGIQSLTPADLTLVTVMGGMSVIGASIGVVGRERLPLRPLKVAVCVYLAVIGLWMLYESFTLAEHVLFDPGGITRVAFAVIVAFVIAVVSGGLGVAGGEMRIPALLYLFAMPIQTAGIISLMVSVPTLVAGAFTDRRIGGLPNAAARIAALMGVASAIGVILGTALLPYASRNLIRGTLGAVLILAAIHLALHRAEHSLSEASFDGAN
jgi:uncharacterized membrane protein YfcA